MKTKSLFGLLLGLIITVSCSYENSLPKSSLQTTKTMSKLDHPGGERVVEGTIRNAWESGETRYIEVEVVGKDFEKGDSMVFWDKHFKNMSPKKNDCVKVWVQDDHYSDNKELLTIIPNRNIASCEK